MTSLLKDTYEYSYVWINSFKTSCIKCIKIENLQQKQPVAKAAEGRLSGSIVVIRRRTTCVLIRNSENFHPKSSIPTEMKDRWLISTSTDWQEISRISIKNIHFLQQLRSMIHRMLSNDSSRTECILIRNSENFHQKSSFPMHFLTSIVVCLFFVVFSVFSDFQCTQWPRK